MKKTASQLKLRQIERPLIAYSLCFDDVMKTLLEEKCIAYDKPFAGCWEFEYRFDGVWSEAIKFPSAGFRKYINVGIEIQRRKIEGQSTLREIVKMIGSGEFVPLHYDGYYCPWDKLQKVRRWHNSHTVLIYAADRKRKRFLADDPYYGVSGKGIPYASLGNASRFYLSVKTENYIDRSYEELYVGAEKKLQTERPIENMERFLTDFKAGDVDNGVFDAKWVAMIEKGYMTRHYLRLFYVSLYRETGKTEHGMAAMLFYTDLQHWKECVTQSHKGFRGTNKSTRKSLFVQAFERVIETEKQIYNVLHGEGLWNARMIAAKKRTDMSVTESLDLLPLYNARACKRTRREKTVADVTGEGEYILPKRKYRKKLKTAGVCFPLRLGESFDNVTCKGQKISVEGEWRGVAFLACSEWGRSQFSVIVETSDCRYICDAILNDFTNPASNSVLIGCSCLSGTSKDTVFQKKIYVQSVTIELPQRSYVKSIVMPECPSVHVFSAVLLK